MSGDELKVEMVVAARAEELKYFGEMGVYEYANIDECQKMTGKMPIGTRWIDMNKGDSAAPKYRSRLVAKEYKVDVRPELYAATPPTECLRMLLSKASEDKSNKVLYIDVSRAFVYAKAVRPTYINLPAEDPRSGEPGLVGKLLMSMYGTRDAAQNWAEEYSATLIKDGYERGVANPCLFFGKKENCSIMVHGDDFVAVGSETATTKLRLTLEKAYKIKSEILGAGSNDLKEIRVLNRVVKCNDRGYTLEADPRHAEIAIRDLGLSDAKPSKLPGSKEEQKKSGGGPAGAGDYPLNLAEAGAETRNWEFPSGRGKGRGIVEEIMAVGDDKVEEEVDESILGAVEAKLYRGVAARLNYMGPDRPDMQYAIKEAARAMSSPRQCDWAILKKAVRYLLYRPRLVMRYDWQSKQTCIDGYTDSDWAGCSKSRKSTSGAVIMLGKHLVKSYSRMQKVIAMSSAEAETYGMVSCSAEILGIQACARDMGMYFEATIYADASAALGIVQRRGIGKVRHIRTQSLWLQEAHATKRLGFEKIDGTRNPSDLMTKHLTDTLQQRHLEYMCTQVESGRAETAPTLNNLEADHEHYFLGTVHEEFGKSILKKEKRKEIDCSDEKIEEDLTGRICEAASARAVRTVLREKRKTSFSPFIASYNITPYSEIFGRHPNSFDFDSVGNMLPIRGSLHIPAESQEEECEGKLYRLKRQLIGGGPILLTSGQSRPQSYRAD